MEELKYIVKEGKKDGHLLIMLHGYGSNEHDLYGFASYLPDDFTIVSLRAPREIAMGGFAWYDIDFTNGEKFNNLDQAGDSLQQITDLIQFFQDKYQIGSQKTWLLGFSQGAILSYAINLLQPELITYTIALSGYILPEFHNDAIRKNYEHLRIFASHGTQDPIIPIDWAQHIPHVLKDVSIEHSFHTYAAGHTVAQDNFADVLEFMKTHLQ